MWFLRHLVRSCCSKHSGVHKAKASSSSLYSVFWVRTQNLELFACANEIFCQSEMAANNKFLSFTRAIKKYVWNILLLTRFVEFKYLDRSKNCCWTKYFFSMRTWISKSAHWQKWLQWKSEDELLRYSDYPAKTIVWSACLKYNMTLLWLTGRRAKMILALVLQTRRSI